MAGLLAWRALLKVPVRCPLRLKGGPIMAGVLAWWTLLEEVPVRCPLRLKGGPIMAGVLAWWVSLEEVPVRCPLSSTLRRNFLFLRYVDPSTSTT